MTLRLGDAAPDFTAETTRGRIEFHSWLGDSWAVLFSHPRDFTPVCTTEMGQVALLERQFQRRGVKLIGLSIDTVVSHEQWLHDIRDTMGANVHFPIIADIDCSISPGQPVTVSWDQQIPVEIPLLPDMTFTMNVAGTFRCE